MERNGRKTGDSASGTECITANIRRKWLQLLWHHTFIFRFFWCEILNSVCSYYANHKKTWGALQNYRVVFFKSKHPGDANWVLSEFVSVVVSAVLSVVLGYLVSFSCLNIARFV